MCGGPVTSGLSWKRRSRVASRTTRASACAMVCEQNATCRSVSHRSRPTFAWKTCRSWSTSETKAVGT
ncbi:PAN domain-containing protein [Methylobacterium tardum]|uniref:PAN domain-containing protein n=1 Tax=Methylobacterium tardum TaxID=374432 RepID=UPI0036187EB7